MTEFSGKIVLVTGGASGIGAAATRAFAAAGAAVAFTYATSRDEAAALEAEIRQAGGKALAIEADLTHAAGTDQAFAALSKGLGPLDILFANAGGLLQRSRAVDMEPELWDRSVGVNLDSTYLTCRAALKVMEPRRSGAIVTMSSLAAFDGGGHGASHYAAMKGAIVTYTRALAKEVGPLGIRVNAVAPGLIATRFHDIFNTRKADAPRWSARLYAGRHAGGCRQSCAVPRLGAGLLHHRRSGAGEWRARHVLTLAL